MRRKKGKQKISGSKTYDAILEVFMTRIVEHVHHQQQNHHHYCQRHHPHYYRKDHDQN